MAKVPTPVTLSVGTVPGTQRPSTKESLMGGGELPRPEVQGRGLPGVSLWAGRLGFPRGSFLPAGTPEVWGVISLYDQRLPPATGEDALPVEIRPMFTEMKCVWGCRNFGKNNKIP